MLSYAGGDSPSHPHWHTARRHDAPAGHVGSQSDRLVEARRDAVGISRRVWPLVSTTSRDALDSGESLGRSGTGNWFGEVGRRSLEDVTEVW